MLQLRLFNSIVLLFFFDSNIRLFLNFPQTLKKSFLNLLYLQAKFSDQLGLKI